MSSACVQQEQSVHIPSACAAGGSACGRRAPGCPLPCVQHTQGGTSVCKGYEKVEVVLQDVLCPLCSTHKESHQCAREVTKWRSCSRMSPAMRSRKTASVSVNGRFQSTLSCHPGATGRSPWELCWSPCMPPPRMPESLLPTRPEGGLARQQCTGRVHEPFSKSTFQVVQHQAMDADLARAARIGVQLPPHPAMAVHPAGHISARPIPHVQRPLSLAGLLLLVAAPPHPLELS